MHTPLPYLPRSGVPSSLSHGDYTADIASTGATLRTLRFRGRDLIVPFDADAIRPCFHGSVLAPWPNRLADGCFTHEGRQHQLPLSEPGRNNALHGLATWLPWDIEESTASSLTLTTQLAAQPGYPWTLELKTTYILSDHGLSWTIESYNAGSGTAPYGVGTHPYLTPGTGTVNDWTFHLPAGDVMETTPDRLLPHTIHRVEDFLDGALDFRETRPVNATQIDHAYTGLMGNREGKVQATVISADGQGTVLEWNPTTLPWAQVFTSDLADRRFHRTGIAVEAQTCAPDAFNNKCGLLHLEAGEHHKAQWIIRAL